MPDFGELAAQVPALIVMLLLVIYFLRAMKGRDEAHGKDMGKVTDTLTTLFDRVDESAREDRKIQSQAIEVIAKNSEVLVRSESAMREVADTIRSCRRS